MSRTSPLAATLLASALIASPALSTTAAPSASLSGEILGGNLEGAIVHAANAGATVRSTPPLAADGRFSLDGLSEGTWSLAVETAAGLHVAATPVVVHAGERRTLQITLAPAQAEPVPGDKGKKKGAMAWWNNPLTASLAVVGAAIVLGVTIDQVTDDDVASTSPSTP